MSNIQLEVCNTDIELLEYADEEEERSEQPSISKTKSQQFRECFWNKSTMLRLSALLLVLIGLMCGFFLFPVEV